jgi:hypothetical protein
VDVRNTDTEPFTVIVGVDLSSGPAHDVAGLESNQIKRRAAWTEPPTYILRSHPYLGINSASILVIKTLQKLKTS